MKRLQALSSASPSIQPDDQTQAFGESPEKDNVCRQQYRRLRPPATLFYPSPV
jgi:hypothetical protein